MRQPESEATKKRSSARMRQPMISSFFSQTTSGSQAGAGSEPLSRSHSPIDLTISDDEEPPPKKQRIAHGPALASTTTSQRQSQSLCAPASQWRYDPSPSPEKRPLDPATKGRRELFAKQLLVDDRAFVDTSGASDGHGLPSDHPDGAPDSSGAESDGKFQQLQELFARKTGQEKKKGKVTRERSSKKQAELGPSGEPYTALELQVRQLKAEHEGVLLMIEVGYKYRFFGEDAKIAAKELGIVAYPDRNFIVASIPTHRRDIHLRKLLSRGYKVGIIAQTETAALKKVGENRNAPFERELTHLYTAVTYVDDIDSADEVDSNDAPVLMCLVEQQRGGMGADEKVNIGMIAICPSTGDVVWDQFEDGHMRTELETRIMHCKPAELLLAEQRLTKPSERMLKYFAGSATTEHGIRIERYKNQMSYTDAFEFVSQFYTQKTQGGKVSTSFTSGKLMAEVADFPKQVIMALAQCIEYLSAFRVADTLLATKFFAKFTTRAHMLLNGNTLTNLEIYQNDTDFTSKGSLMWILNKTVTKFGSRLLRSWVGKPLMDIAVLQERIDAIEEIISTSSQHVHTLRPILRGLPDLAKGLCRIQYGKCTPKELATLLPAFNKIASAFPSFESPSVVGFKSALLNSIFFALPILREPVQQLMDAVVLKKAAAGNKAEMWVDPERYPEIADADGAIILIEKELDDQLKIIRGQLMKPALQWAAVSGDEYLVEVSRSEDMSKIPHTWFMHSSTKKVRRYYTPVVKEKLALREQLREMREAAANKAFLSFLEDLAHSQYAILRDAVNKLATIDCLLSLALVAMRNDYVKPHFTTEEDVLEIVDGRHPMVETLRVDPFVPNSVALGGGEPRSKVITGPNMGGKSSAVRMIALIAIMAQIGSYVPATAVRLSMLDGVLTRMGASDELARGRSTFMVEMSETSDILVNVTNKSLVILDELGRGTSTFDGMAIAHAVLHYLIHMKHCKTLFITHYPLLGADLERRFPEEVQSLHMGFTEDTRINGMREITFLYRLSKGLATESFGIECARLAGVAEDVLETATQQADRMRVSVEEKTKRNKVRKALKLLSICSSGSSVVDATVAMEQLRGILPS
ncbi:DNA mismatch repair protein MSH3 [Russula earlei]|uniref:DNA mismatch repair protein MSH3 n=1 Tax=Russula earlei TaxID=71964 RepID=A0ACC0U1I5_9AGAM|nr:DNA mismatch repair protein MSH3 [Russula earlei]